MTDFSAEQSAFFRCARASAPDAAALRADCARVADWGLFLDCADFHGLQPMLAATFETSCDDAAPPEAMARLKDAYRDSAMRALLLTDRLHGALAALNASGVAAIPLKGPMLAETIYPDPALRPYCDLDLLLRPEDAPAALRTLADQGYSLPPHLARLDCATLLGCVCEATVVDAKRVAIDLHWAVAPSDYPFRVDPEILWRNLHTAEIGGRRIETTLSPEALLVYLCVHGTKHCWARLIWLADIARLAETKIDWDASLRLARKTGCENPVLLGLLLARDLLGAKVPRELAERAAADPRCASAALDTQAALRRLPPQEPGGLALTHYNARLAPHMSQRLSHYAALLRAPTEAELALAPLPRSLFPLYVPIRILRIAMKYGLGSVASLFRAERSH